MFVVERVARGHRYLYLVESVREGKTVRQRTIKALGRKDVLAASGELDRLAASIARHAERSVIPVRYRCRPDCCPPYRRPFAVRALVGAVRGRCGAGGETLGRRGHSKDHRPELAQMILAVVIDAEGRPI